MHDYTYYKLSVGLANLDTTLELLNHYYNSNQLIKISNLNLSSSAERKPGISSRYVLT